MDHASHTLDTSCAGLYVSQIETLRKEIDAAIASIATNDSHALQESVMRQEFLAAGLAFLLRQMKSELPSSQHRAHILNSADRLRHTVQCYSALLQHSGRSITVRASLCRSHTLPAFEVRGARPVRQTWSCEM